MVNQGLDSDMINVMRITEPVNITVNDHRYLLETGDEIIDGGMADSKTAEDIAKKHGVSVEEINEQIKMGIEVEKEHTDDEKIAEEIAKDHLWEIPDYYTRLKKMEDEAKQELGIEEDDKEVVTEAAVHRRYLKISDKNGDRYFAPASANDNYVLHFLERLFKSRKFQNGDHKAKVVERMPSGQKHLSLETFLRELIPIPEKK